MESNFLQFTYVLGILGLYFGYSNFSKVSANVFSKFVYPLVQRPFFNYPASNFLGFISNLLFGRTHRIHGFIQGAVYLRQLTAKKAMGFLIGSGFATVVYFLLFSQLVKMQMLIASVVISIFGILALLVFRADDFRLHGQWLFYFGIMLLGFAWIHELHQVWFESMVTGDVWFWVNQNYILVFLIFCTLSIFLQTALIASVISLSLLHLDMVTFQAGLAIFLGGYIGSPIGSLLVYAKVPKTGFALQIVHILMRICVSAFSLVWIHYILVSPETIDLLPTEILALVFLVMQFTLFGLYWPFQKKIYASVHDNMIATKLDPYRHFANQPVLCFEIAKSHVLEMSTEVGSMVAMLCEPFIETGRDAMIEMDEHYDRVEKMARQINFYLSKINLAELSYTDSQKETHWLRVSYALKDISSFINRNVMNIASQYKERGITFEANAWEQVQDCHRSLMENFEEMVANLENEHPENMKKIARNQKQIHSRKEEIKQAYLQDFKTTDQVTTEGVSLFMSLLSYFQFLNISIARLAYPTTDRRR